MEMFIKWIELIIAVLSGLAVAIPLAAQLVKYVKLAVKEKNWNQVLSMVLDLMKTAETKFNEGAERKEWVLAMLKASADELNYEIDYIAIGNLIDKLCEMSKVVNSQAEG